MLILQLICSSKTTDLEAIEAIFDATYLYLTEDRLIEVSLGIMGLLIDGQLSAKREGMLKRMLTRLNIRLGLPDRYWLNLPPVVLN